MNMKKSEFSSSPFGKWHKTHITKLMNDNGYTLLNRSDVISTSHSNISALEKNGKKYIAKLVHYKENFDNEVAIYKMLPVWWPVQMVDYFDTKYVFANPHSSPDYYMRVIVTTVFIESGHWSTTRLTGTILDKLFTQLDYLHKLGVIHCDFIWKNVLLNSDTQDVCIIDFEKSCPIYTECKENRLNDYASFLVSFLGKSNKVYSTKTLNYKNMMAVFNKVNERIDTNEKSEFEKRFPKDVWLAMNPSMRDGALQRTIVFKGSKRAYVVRTHLGRTYIVRKKEKVFLGDVRGTYSTPGGTYT